MEAKWDAENGTYNKGPHIIVYGMPDIPIQDKWALLALIGMCWGPKGTPMEDLEGPYKLSLREIATITGVKHNALRSTGGKEPRLGILDRWQDMGYLSIVDARSTDEITGNLGRKQTFLYIHLRKIWADNLAFVTTWNRPPKRLVDENSLFTT